MLACEGYVENGQFHPTGTLTRTPTRMRAFLTVLDEPIKSRSSKIEDVMAFWKNFDMQAAASANEEMYVEDFPRMNFGREPIAFAREG